MCLPDMVDVVGVVVVVVVVAGLVAAMWIDDMNEGAGPCGCCFWWVLTFWN